MTTRNFSALFALLTIVMQSPMVIGQEDYAMVQEESARAVAIQPQACVAPLPPPVRLGLMAIDSYGYLEVTSVEWNSAASRLGLEAGDRILEINSHPVRTGAELRQLLQEAVANHGGQVRVLIDNVRARHGEYGAQRYVMNQTWLDGYRPLPVPGIPQPYGQPATPVVMAQPAPVAFGG
jgi:membrane-associated protease RseP (regulator of RpoE activity)